jgi:hypothetical protein
VLSSYLHQENCWINASLFGGLWDSDMDSFETGHRPAGRIVSRRNKLCKFVVHADQL